MKLWRASTVGVSPGDSVNLGAKGSQVHFLLCCASHRGDSNPTIPRERVVRGGRGTKSVGAGEGPV
jgi:hypothetical protein